MILSMTDISLRCTTNNHTKIQDSAEGFINGLKSYMKGRL